jgi:hypothetical protein
MIVPTATGVANSSCEIPGRIVLHICYGKKPVERPPTGSSNGCSQCSFGRAELRAPTASGILDFPVEEPERASVSYGACQSNA